MISVDIFHTRRLPSVCFLMKFDIWGLFKILNHLREAFFQFTGWNTFFHFFGGNTASSFFASKQRCAALRNFTWLFSTTEEEKNTSLLILEGWWEGGGCSFKPLSSSIFGGRSAALTPTVELWDSTDLVPTQRPHPTLTPTPSDSVWFARTNMRRRQEAA